MATEPWHWLVFGIALMIGEMFVPTFALLWFGSAALIVAIALFVAPIGFLGQVILWLALSVLFCVGWFKFIKPLSVNRTKAGLGASVIVGEAGLIVKPPTSSQAGIIRFNVPKAGSSQWACRSQDDDALQVGDRAWIVGIVGNELLVSKNKETIHKN